MDSRGNNSHYVYILRCATGDLYTGYTVNPEKRLVRHNRGIASKFTRSRLPVRMVHIEMFRSKSTALKREIAIKRLNRKEKLELCSVFTKEKPNPSQISETLVSASQRMGKGTIP